MSIFTLPVYSLELKKFLNNSLLLPPARRPISSTTPATPAASTNGEASHRRRVITKPPVPKQTPLEKKPPVPRAPRNSRSINAPTPDLKNVRSKIGSIDNIKYQPGGGKVRLTALRENAVKVTQILLNHCSASAGDLACLDSKLNAELCARHSDNKTLFLGRCLCSGFTLLRCITANQPFFHQDQSSSMNFILVFRLG